MSQIHCAHNGFSCIDYIKFYIFITECTVFLFIFFLIWFHCNNKKRRKKIENIPKQFEKMGAIYLEIIIGIKDRQANFFLFFENRKGHPNDIASAIGLSICPTLQHACLLSGMLSLFASSIRAWRKVLSTQMTHLMQVKPIFG